ncbi:MAG: hypothetical protein IJV97_04550 [Alphaproteobacteria bacterium]|nr:hypothetical protein [Alphaproteobacteria bacterium]
MKIEKILRKEYIKRGMSPKKIMVNGVLITVPYIYVAKNKNFPDDFWDVNEQNIQEYKKAGKTPKTILHKGQNYVVPLADSEKRLTNAEIAKKVTQQAINKYKKSIVLTMLLRKVKNNPQMPFYIDKSTFACRKGMLMAKLNLNTIEFDISEVKDFFDRGIKAVHSYNWNVAWKRVKKATATVFTATSLIGGGIFVSGKLSDKEKLSDNKNEKQSEVTAPPEEKKTATIDYQKAEETATKKMVNLPQESVKMNFAEKCAGKYNDKYGNLAMLDAAYDDICVLLAMFENYSAKAYDDGWGNETIGWGITSYLDKYGRHIRAVKSGDEVTMNEAVMQKDLYLYYVAVPKLAKVNHAMTQEEVAAFATVAWLLGPRNLEHSFYYKKLLNNDASCWNNLVSYSSNPAIKKRMAATKDFATGKIETNDLIRLPAGIIYNYSLEKYNSGSAALEIKRAASCSSSYKLQNKLPEFVVASVQNKNAPTQIAQNRNTGRG